MVQVRLDGRRGAADGGVRPALRLVARLGLATRMGLEDTPLLPDGRRASSDAQSVAEAPAQYGWSQHSS
ncbi:hypothetical protein [Streptomyces sp. NPDC002088]|uniref:hypothetical protein n=1 Tax=Streptomyces sp. NPDC002088 TaxID=3154665 RepID=UPI003325A4D2